MSPNRALIVLVIALLICLCYLGSRVRAADPAPLAIAGKTSYAAYDLVDLAATNVPDKAAVVWRVSPDVGVTRAATERSRLQLAAPPGKYVVDLLAVALVGDRVELAEARVTVTIAPPIAVSPPAGPGTSPAPSPAPATTREGVRRAIGRIVFGSSGCTATVIAPRRPDGRYDVLTASHCVPGLGARGTMTMPDGKRFGVSVTAYDRVSDTAWLATDREDLDELPLAELATQLPTPGSNCWHSGYGVDNPGNVEEGVVLGSPIAQGKITCRLSVSSGDSGGGIFLASNNQLVGQVCCSTVGLAPRVMFAGSCVSAWRIRPGARQSAEADDWLPTPMPTITHGGEW